MTAGPIGGMTAAEIQRSLECSQGKGEQTKDTRTFIMQKLNAAQLNLQEAYKAGMEKNAMVQDVPAFLEMQQLAKDISAVMLKVAKVRGL